MPVAFGVRYISDNASRTWGCCWVAEVHLDIVNYVYCTVHLDETFFELHHVSSPRLSSITFYITERLHAECLNRPAAFDKFNLPHVCENETLCAYYSRSQCIVARPFVCENCRAYFSVRVLFISLLYSENCSDRYMNSFHNSRKKSLHRTVNSGMQKLCLWFMWQILGQYWFWTCSEFEIFEFQSVSKF